MYSSIVQTKFPRRNERKLSWTAVAVMMDNPRGSGKGREAVGMVVENCCIERMRRPREIGSQIVGITYHEVRVNT